MALKTVYENEDDIPEGFESLYTEKGGRWELTGIEGVKTDADIVRVKDALRKEREDHKQTKDKLQKFEGLDADEVRTTMDEIEELRVKAEAGGGQIDEEKLEKLAARKADAKTAPLQRELDKISKELQDREVRVKELEGRISSSKIEAKLRQEAEKLKIVPSAIDDVVSIGSNLFELTEDGDIVSRETAIGVDPNIPPDVWLQDQKDKRPHWWPESQGGGASGSREGANASGNPWSEAHWNVTEQGRFLREKGREKAEQMAKAAGSQLGATRPAKKSA